MCKFVVEFKGLELTHKNRVSVQELAMNLKVASRNPVFSQLCVSSEDAIAPQTNPPKSQLSAGFELFAC
jgi:hypothetical protein